MNEEILNSKLTKIKPFEMDAKPHKDTIEKLDIPVKSASSHPECVVCATTNPETTFIYTSCTKLGTSLPVFVQTFIKPSWKPEDPSKCMKICKSCLDVVNDLESVQMQFKIHGDESTDSDSDIEPPNIKRFRSSKEIEGNAIQTKDDLLSQNSETDEDRVNRYTLDCNICDRRYVQYSFGRDLTKENRSDVPVDCLICKSLFVYKPSKNRKPVTDSQPFGCMLCRCRFGRQETFEQHLKYHTSQIPYQCHACELKFHKRPHLLTHLKSCKLCVCGIKCYQFLVTKKTPCI